MRALVVVASLLFACIPAQAASYYVSTSGDDGNDCLTVGAPCATVEHARDLVRTAIAGGALSTGSIAVYLRGGTYQQTDTLQFTSADSGTSTRPVTWASYPNETAVIDGGQTITGWSAYSGSIFRASVGSLRFRQLYVNGTRATRARGASSTWSAAHGWDGLTGWSRTGTGYTMPDSAMASWGNKPDIEMVTLATWSMHRCKVATIVGTAVTMTDPCWTYDASVQARYSIPDTPTYIENAYELMASGYWYLDTTTNYLYYWPPSGSMSGVTVVAPVVEPTLVDIDGASNLRFTGLSFKHSNWTDPGLDTGYVGIQAGYRWTSTPYQEDPPTAPVPPPAGMRVNASTAVTFSRDEFTQMGSRALIVEGGSSAITIEGSSFTANAGGAMQIGVTDGCPATNESNITIRDNYVVGNEIDYSDNGGIFAPCLYNSSIVNNEIGSTNWSGAAVGWGWSTTPYSATNTIRGNYIHDVCLGFPDCGGIYTVGAQSTSASYATGDVVTRNYVRDAYPWFGSEAICLYPDEGSSWSRWTGNVCQSTPLWAHVHVPTVNNIDLTGNFASVASQYDNSGTNVTISATQIGTGPQSHGTTAHSIICAAGVSAGVKPGTSASTLPRLYGSCEAPKRAAQWPTWGKAKADSQVAHVAMSEGRGSYAYNYAAATPIGTWAGSLTSSSHYSAASGTTYGVFDGTTNYVSLGNPSGALLPASSAWTVTGWFNKTAESATFTGLGQSASIPWGGMAVSKFGNVYSAAFNGDIYQRTGDAGNFTTLSQGNKLWYAMGTSYDGSDVYVTVISGDIYKQTGGTGNFVALGQTARSWSGIDGHPNGDIYACANNGGIYKQTGGSGNFNDLSQGALHWYALAVSHAGDVYAAIQNGDIYKQTGGTGNFVATGQTSRNWYALAGAPNGDMYATTSGGDVYRQAAGTSTFVALSQTSRPWTGIAVGPDGRVYASASNVDVFRSGTNQPLFAQYATGGNSPVEITVAGREAYSVGLNLGARGAVTSAGVRTTTQVAAGGWHFFAASRSGATLGVSIDGSAAETITDGDGSRALIQTGNVLGGAASSSTYSTIDHFLRGGLRDVRVYTRALSSDETRRLYNAER